MKCKQSADTNFRFTDKVNSLGIILYHKAFSFLCIPHGSPQRSSKPYLVLQAERQTVVAHNGDLPQWLATPN